MLHSSVSLDMTTPSKASVREAYEDSSYLKTTSDKDILDLTTEKDRMRKTSNWQSLDENMSPFVNQLPEHQSEPLQKQVSEEKEGADSISSSDHPHQMSFLVRDEKQSDSDSKADSAFQVGGSQRPPEKIAQDQTIWTDHHSKEESCLNLLSQGQGIGLAPFISGEGSNPTVEQMQSDNNQKKKICLSALEKLELSRLNSLSASFDFSDTGMKESGFSRESDFLEDDSDSEEEEGEEAESLDLGINMHFLSLAEDTQYPTWKKTLLRRAKEAEMKRFCKAQAIQRRLEEIEVTFQELEKQGIKVEQSLRKEAGTESELKKQWMNQLLTLIQKKNSLMSEESDLMIDVKELKLEEQQCQLDQELRRYYNMDDALKTSEDCKAEKMILSQLVAVVNQRSALIEMQERKRLDELSEHPPMMGNV